MRDSELANQRGSGILVFRSLLAGRRLAVDAVYEQVSCVALGTQSKRLRDVVSHHEILDLFEAALWALDDLEDLVRGRVCQHVVSSYTHQRKADKTEGENCNY